MSHYSVKYYSCGITLIWPFSQISKNLLAFKCWLSSCHFTINASFVVSLVYLEWPRASSALISVVVPYTFSFWMVDWTVLSEMSWEYFYNPTLLFHNLICGVFLGFHDAVWALMFTNKSKSAFKNSCRSTENKLHTSGVYLLIKRLLK